MKNILVPTDFSKNADNAVEYAIKLAEMTGAKITLLHVFTIPYPATDVPLFVLPVDDLRLEFTAQLEKLGSDIRSRCAADCTIEVLNEIGYPKDEIVAVAEKIKADIIVMGIRGMGKIEELFIGSTTTNVVHHSSCPVIVVPEKSSFIKPDKIVFAFDFIKKNSAAVIQLKDFALLFDTQVFAVNITINDQLKEAELKLIKNEFDSIFSSSKFSLSFQKNENVIDGILKYAENMQAAMIAVVPHKHNFFHDLFIESKTDILAFHTNLPVLVLPEKS